MGKGEEGQDEDGVDIPQGSSALYVVLDLGLML